MLCPVRFVQTSRGTVALRDTGGDGLPVLLVHGAGFDSRIFSRQFDSPLAQTRRLIALDLPGHGATPPSQDPGTDYRLPEIADMFARVLDSLGIARVVLMGWSLGGHIGIEMMARHPDRLAGVMACATAPLGPGPVAALRAFHVNLNLLLFSKPGFSRQEAERFAHVCFAEQADQSHVEAILGTDPALSSRLRLDLVRGAASNQKQVVQTSPVPLAMVNGSEDAIVRLSYIASLAYGNLWEGRCHEIENARHGAFFTAPHAFNALLHRFATDVELTKPFTPQNWDRPAKTALPRL